MTISIDANVIAALWDSHHVSNADAAKALGSAQARGKLVICAPVYSELMAGPLRDEALLQMFLSETRIDVDWILDESVWREAGLAFRSFARRRKRSGVNPPRRILADFIIGAHAVVRGYSLLTLDGDDFRTAFPTLKVISA